MSKIKVLVVPSDRSGVSKFRSVDPHLKLQELYGDDFFVDIVTAGTDNFNWDDDNFIKGFDIVHFHRALPQVKNGQLQPAYGEDSERILQKFKKHGVKTVMDLDDYWMVTPDHPAYNQLKNSGLDKHIIHNIKLVDYVTTTTKIYAKEISKHNKNVVVLPNSVDPSEEQFQSKPEPTDKKLRVGWLGGSSHLEDLKLASDSVGQFLSKHKEDTQFVLCGFDLRGNMREINKATGEVRTRPIRPEETVWFKYEKMFTDDYKSVDEEYAKYLSTWNKSPFPNELNKPYVRRWTLDINKYATNYNYFDVSLAPLVPSEFNKNKSQLKVIEAGFHKKALIATAESPYTLDLVDAFDQGSFNDKGNALLVKSSKNHKQWFQQMKRLMENPNLIEDLGNKLYETVKDEYSLSNVSKNRVELLKTIINN